MPVYPLATPSPFPNYRCIFFLTVILLRQRFRNYLILHKFGKYQHQSEIGLHNKYLHNNIGRRYEGDREARRGERTKSICRLTFNQLEANKKNHEQNIANFLNWVNFYRNSHKSLNIVPPVQFNLHIQRRNEVSFGKFIIFLMLQWMNQTNWTSSMASLYRNAYFYLSSHTT